ncbi:MAG: ABC transporter ATP-binding protein [Candidatus Hodarchaeota archaeon]
MPSLFKRFISYYKPHLKTFILVISCAFLVASLELVFPTLTKYFINDYIPNGKLNLIFIWTIALLCMYIIRAIAQYIMTYWGHTVGTKMEANMRSDLFQHMQTLPFKFYDDNKTGQLMSRLVGDLREVSEMAHHGPEDLFISFVMLVGSFIALFFINWLLTVIIFMVLIVLIFFSNIMRARLMKTFRRVRVFHGEINAKVENSLSGIRLCQSFTNEEYEIEQFEVRNTNYQKSYMDAYKQMAEYHGGTKFLLEFLLLLVLSIGGYFVFKNWFPPGDLVAFLLYTAFFMKPIERLVQFTREYQNGIAGFERFLEIMDLQSNIRDKPGAKDLVDTRGFIRFENVTFQYGENQELVLRDLNLEIKPGMKIALVGISGVGKTTIAHLIPRFYDVTAGKVTIDSVDVRDITLKSLRKNIGLVQQDTFIFWGTIGENIFYGKPDASEEEVIEAAKKAQIHDFIMSLPDKYDTLVGERGIKLSGGQKQRVSIARVFLKNPPILVLDEATSSLDNTTEIAIQGAIDQLVKNRTTLIVAHRLSTIINADQILFIKDDGVAERGTHDELMELNGLYADLYKAQADEKRTQMITKQS